MNFIFVEKLKFSENLMVFIFGNYIHLYSITLVKGCKRILY